jgi:hypothetical protein
MKVRSEDQLPEIWQSAFARDRTRKPDYADPRPERKAARMLAAFVTTGLAFLVLPGTLLGVWNLISIAHNQTTGAASIAWIQAHGQAQLLGWVGTFILGISIYVLPKFQGHPLRQFGSAWAVWVLWTTGVAWRWWVGVYGYGWRFGLPASAALELVAYAISQYVLLVLPARRGERKAPADLGSWLGIFGFASLGLALLLNLWISLQVVVRGAAPVYPPVEDRMYLFIVLWCFAVPVVWGYSTRFVTVFLGLQPPRHAFAAWLCAGIAAMLASAAGRHFLVADILALGLTIVSIQALRLFHAGVRPAKLRAVYRGYPLFVRISYAWLLAGASLGVLADLIPSQAGLGGAGRHAVTVGCLATLIFTLAPRILPAFLSGRELYSSKLMAISLWVLTAGCTLRVSSEIMAYSRGGSAWLLLPVSALLELTAVVVFAINMGTTLTGPLTAWLEPQGVTDRLPLYWFVTSFPETEPLLVQAGLGTLAVVNRLPRSLTLAEAIRADGADYERVMQALRDFFTQRQPRGRHL